MADRMHSLIAPCGRARKSPAAFARALAASTSGLAMLEFAFALPVLLTLSLVGIEVSHFAMANLRVSNIAVMTADNAARVRDTIDEADVVELMTGAKMTGGEIDFGRHGRIILSSIEANTAGFHGASTASGSAGSAATAPSASVPPGAPKARGRTTPACCMSDRRTRSTPRPGPR